MNLFIQHANKIRDMRLLLSIKLVTAQQNPGLKILRAYLVHLSYDNFLVKLHKYK